MSDHFVHSKIMKLEEGAKTEVRSFDYHDLKKSGNLVYQTPTLKKSETTEEGVHQRKASRFQFDPVLKDLVVMDEKTDIQIQAEVETRVESIRAATEEKAREAGQQQGFEAGKEEAMLQYRAEAKGKLVRLESLITRFESMKDEIFKAQERFVLESIVRMTQSVILKELQTDKEFLNRTIHSIFDKIGAREQVKIYVHPEQLEQVYSVMPELEKKYEALKSISIEPSDQLGEHDCVVETDWNRVDASIQSQIDSFRELLISEGKV